MRMVKDVRNWWHGEDLSSSSSFKPFKPSHEASIGAQGDKTDSKLAKNWELDREPRDLPSSINIHNTFSGNIQKIGKINDRMFNTEYQENQEEKRSSRRPKRNRVCYKESSTNSSNSDDSDYVENKEENPQNPQMKMTIKIKLQMNKLPISITFSIT
ncbi:hypothetical protein RclHR1_05140001 [Rhizophagus clarus]|uniref:Uncharacterized protein n=1 Tax=Rhizophagus clarus TaxID=94130 RepID=A0A2Z6SDY4_9GLOM|nr:hypothetical protein RclHR1_05140001 [Rhizophagus clarus]